MANWIIINGESETDRQYTYTAYLVTSSFWRMCKVYPQRYANVVLFLLCFVVVKIAVPDGCIWFIYAYFFGEYLNYRGLVDPHGAIDMDQHWFRRWLVRRWHQSTQTKADLSSIGSVAFTREQFPRKYSWYQPVIWVGKWHSYICWRVFQGPMIDDFFRLEHFNRYRFAVRLFS